MRNFIRVFTLSAMFMLNLQVAYAADGYVDITPPQPTQSGDKIEIVEMFWYGCSHCFDFEPYISKWLETKPDDVEFRRIPGVFRKTWIPHAKAYYTAEKMDVLDKIHSPLFDALHRKRKQIFDDGQIEDFFLDQDIDKGEFRKNYTSDEVDTRVKQAYVMGQRYKVTGVPAIIINGKYMINGSTAGSFENMLKILDQMVDKERARTAGH